LAFAWLETVIWIGNLQRMVRVRASREDADDLIVNSVVSIVAYALAATKAEHRL